MLDEAEPRVEYWILDRSRLLGSAFLPADFRPMSADSGGLWV